jgi:putative endonuclease
MPAQNRHERVLTRNAPAPQDRGVDATETQSQDLDRSERLGALGERLVRERIVEWGWSVLAANLRCARGELDLIAFDSDELVVVEVKTLRRLDHPGIEPFDSIGYRKRKLIKRTTAAWLAGARAVDGTGAVVERPRGSPHLRFDVFAVTVDRRTGAFEIEHLRGAL